MAALELFPKEEDIHTRLLKLNLKKRLILQIQKYFKPKGGESRPFIFRYRKNNFYFYMGLRGEHMDNFVGMKELYDISLRTNRPIEIGRRKFDINETILFFERAEIAQIQEDKRETVAKGGYGNDPLIFWETDKDTRFSMTHGVLSPTSWALLSNSKLCEPIAKSVSYRENLQCIEDGVYCFVDLKYCPNACSEIIGA